MNEVFNLGALVGFAAAFAGEATRLAATAHGAF